MSKHIGSWADSEGSLLSETMEKEKFGWYLTLLCDLVYHCYVQSDCFVLLCHGLAVIVVYYAYAGFRRVTDIKWQLFLEISYFETLQLLHYKWAMSNPAYAFSYSLTSTVILMTRQLSPLVSWSLNLFFICKHVVVWLAISQETQGLGTISIFTLQNLCWTLYHMVSFLQTRVYVLKAEFEHREHMRKKEEHIAALYEALPPGIIVVTEDRKVVSYNQAVLKFYKLENESGDLYGKIYEYMCQDSYLSEYRTADTRSDMLIEDVLDFTVSSEKESKSFGAVLINGKYFEWRANKLDWEDKRACILCMRDITRWIELEAIAKRESDSKTALLRSVSHELRTPTNAIINLVQDIKEKAELSQESQQDASMLSSSAYFLLSMINDLLDYSSIANGKFGLTKQYFPLEGTIRECVQLIEFQCKHKNLELIIRYDPLLPALAYNDKNRLKQVILNLLSNALKFTMTGKIEVVAISVSDTHAGIRVIDTGVGISEESIGKIFKLFGKLEGNEKLNPQGCGLGLGISSMLVKSMGGSGVHVKSKRHVGSLFSFEFAVSRSEDQMEYVDSLIDTRELWENVEKIQVPVSITLKTQGTFPHILIADDVDYNRIVLRKILEVMGYDCDEASTGLQVLEDVKSRAKLGKPYLAILMDVEMPEMDGITATRELSAMANRGDLETFPVVIGCSAYSSLEDKEICLKAGMQYYLEKPVVRETLYDLLIGIVPRTAADQRSRGQLD